MTISIVIPAFDEGRFLPETIEHLRQAIKHLGDVADQLVEIIVVDNASSDGTAAIATALGAKVISIPDHNIALVRNTGANAARGELVVFIDADTIVPENLMSRILEVMDQPRCFGGAVDIDYQPARFLIRVYLRLWRQIGLWLGMAQGAAQFCRRNAFVELGGYDETIYMGEDVDFYWRLSRLAQARRGYVQLLRDVTVHPSCRRFDQWPIARILVETNPLYIWLFRRRQTPWRGWYQDVPR